MRPRQGMRRAMAWVAGLSGLLAFASPGIGRGGESTGAAVLGDDSFLRAYLVYRTPVVVTAEGQTGAAPDPSSKEPRPIADFQSTPPPADWTKPEFDDSTWERRRAPVDPELPPYPCAPVDRYGATATALICLRGKFVVEDPARVQDLKLAIKYVGGAAVFLNGQELARGNLPAGELKPDTLAERYPDDLYCDPDGKLLQDIAKSAANFERRYRELSAVIVPSKLLRKGMNVLAVEIHRAPVNEKAAAAMRNPKANRGLWAYAGLKNLSLTAAPGSALVPNVARPKGIQVWTPGPFDTVTAFDYGDPGEPAPVVVSSPRNGVFSGRVVVSSDQPIKNLKATVSDLAAAEGGGSIPSSAVQVRCADQCEGEAEGKFRRLYESPYFYRFDGLLDAIPAGIPIKKSPHFRITREYQKNLSAMAPLWVKVHVPKDTKAGLYRGTISLAADGLPSVAVPLQVAVSGWTLPDPKDFRVTNFGQSSPDSLAQHYGIPLWSDRHFAMMGRSMALMAEVNSRRVDAELAISFFGLGGNAESMIRWIKQADGSYTHDFTVFDKYLDLVAKNVGKPLPLRLNCWGEFKEGWPNKGEAKMVTRLDPATGKLEPMEQPYPPGTPESYAFWKPVLDEIRKKVEARKWFDVTAMGHNSYCHAPKPEIVSMFKKIWPDGVWSFTAHSGTLGGTFPGVAKQDTMPVRYADAVWTRGEIKTRGCRALLKPRPGFWCYTHRSWMWDWTAPVILREVAEDEIMRGHDGVSDFGVDFFPLKAPDGRYTRTIGCGRGTGGPGDSTMAMLAPGPDGPIATERFEMLREGVEIAEAILFLERALQDKKISGDLEQRVNRCLDERSDAYIWRWSSGRVEREQKLMVLAGEVSGAGK